jgi:hypothetical protein
MFFRRLNLDSRVFRVFISIAILVHLCILSFSWVAQRGTSGLVNRGLTFFATYTAIGNWRPDTTPLTIASGVQLGEYVKVEVHRKDETSENWEPLGITGDGKDYKGGDFFSHAIRREWLQQLNGLLFYEVEEGVTRMLRDSLQADPVFAKEPIDRIRVRVAPRISPEQAISLATESKRIDSRDMSGAEIVYSASIVDLGDGQISFLPELEKRRASKSVVPNSKEARRDK